MESSSIRANEAPYCELHGMSLSGGAYASDKQDTKSRRASVASTVDAEEIGMGPARSVAFPETSSTSCLSQSKEGSADLLHDTQYSKIMEFQMIHDPKANLSNWFFTDIEKILNESYQLNPHGPKDMMLPWEGFVNVGQNPKVGSSIKRTQHTQLCAGSISKYRIFQLSSKPMRSAKLNATIDLVDVAPDGLKDPDGHGVFVKVSTERPTGAALIEFLVELRKRLLERLGGADKVDFFVMCMSDEKGGYVIIFACLPQLQKLGDLAPDFASWKNPLTGESTEDTGLQEARIDFGKGVGHFLVMKTELKAQILEDGEKLVRRIWAFNRVPGSVKVMEEFIAERNIFEPSS